MQQTAVLQLERVYKTYKSGSSDITVLSGLDLRLDRGSFCSLVGPSGSGKTTLLGVSVGLEDVSSGSVSLCGQLLSGMSEDERAILRSTSLGFVFQSFQLIASLTALENVLIPAEMTGMANARERARDLLAKVGLADRAHHYPLQLSGGEQQRVAIARAFINRPTILLADEPTGNLDETTASSVEDLLFDMHRNFETALLIATHNMRLARTAQRILYLEGGVLREEQGGGI